jgi:hypothetical protein
MLFRLISSIISVRIKRIQLELDAGKLGSGFQLLLAGLGARHHKRDRVDLGRGEGVEAQRARQTVPKRVAARHPFASKGFGPCAALGVGAVSSDLTLSRQGPIPYSPCLSRRLRRDVQVPCAGRGTRYLGSCPSDQRLTDQARTSAWHMQGFDQG